MCGIAGAVFWNGGSPQDDPDAIVRRMTRALAHRGPDGQGVMRCSAGARGSDAPVAVLGHRRLAIIDLSERAAQPMANASGTLCLTYNGEIYNFKALRRDLEAEGRRFTSDSDTEVILQGYDAWGEDLFDRLRGMFALAIWDSQRQALLLARDRLGIKPLYVARGDNRLLFASEIRALLASGLVPRRLDTVALDQFLAYQTVPAPRTLVEGVRMVEPAHIVTARSSSSLTVRRYWDPLDSASRDACDASSAEGRARVQDLLVESISLHLVSDVPVGVFLSGGIDSSALVALLGGANVVPRTFSVAFPGTTYDEAPFASAVARTFGANHAEIPLSESDLLAQLPEALGSVDHPSGDGLNTFVISRAVRAAGVKVALSGLGGDELFGGYPSFRRLRRLGVYGRMWGRSPAPVRRAAAAAVRTLGGRSIASAKAAGLLETDGTLPQTFPVMRQLFATAGRTDLIGRGLVEASERAGDPYVALLDQAIDRHPEADLMSLVSYAEARTYMHDVLLRDTDQMSMAHGLEVRVPLLDHRLVEYVMGLPEAVKRSYGAPKGLLVKSLGASLPAECVNRAKRGFVLPLDLWMRGELRPFCEHHLGPDGLAGGSLFRPSGVQALWQSFLADDQRTTWSRPWTLIALSEWLERNGVQA